jgi:hypothetical protein
LAEAQVPVVTFHQTLPATADDRGAGGCLSFIHGDQRPGRGAAHRR